MRLCARMLIFCSSTARTEADAEGSVLTLHPYEGSPTDQLKATPGGTDNCVAQAL